MEQKKSISQKMSALIATVVVVGVLAAVAAATVFTLANNEKPTLSFEGVTLRPVTVQTDSGPVETVQALVDVYAADVEYLAGIQFYLEYNSDYWVPSNADTNEAIDATGDSTVFYKVPADLYGGRNPYYPFTQLNEILKYSVNHIDVDKKELQLILMTRTVDLKDDKNWPEDGSVGKFYFTEAVGETTVQKANLYIAASEKAHIVTLSFQVKPEKLPEMLQYFNEKESVDGIIADKKLLALTTNAATTNFDYAAALAYWSDPVNHPSYSFYTPESPVALSTWFDWDIPDRPVTLQSNEPNVTINAYQAYTGGTVADIVDAIQKYSPTARATYSGGRIEDFLLHWGGNEGCYITGTNGVQHLFRWTKDAGGEYDGGYELQQWDADAKAWISDDGSWYDPTQGKYTVEQYVDYSYEENGVQSSERYEHPVTVMLNVTPVKLTDVTATDLHKTYTSAVARTMGYDSLELPDQALLTTDVVCGSGSLVMNIDDWDPTYTDDMSTIKGLGPNNTTSVTWTAADDANIGSYTFTAKPEFTKTAIRTAYPWLTVTKDYPLKAVRQIVAAEDLTNGGLFEVKGYSDDALGILTLEIYKRNTDDTAYVDMVENTTFRVKLPNGAVIDPTWFGDADSKYTCTGPTEITLGSQTGIGVYYITINPGKASGSHVAERELVRRSINLGGYFQLAVTEPKTNADGSVPASPTYKAESDFIPTYIAPRRNIYTDSYIEAKAFDFTGDRKALLPLYQNTQLSTTVVLPYGSDYSVATRYDGVTGAEPGSMHTVVVDGWNYSASTAQNDGAWNGSEWTGTAPITVTYGEDPFADKALITGYGQVENPADKEKVEILMEVSAKEAPLQALRLTYEGTGASVAINGDGEVEQVTFDPRSVGYEDAQRVTLTLTNTGDTDIRGLYLDTRSANGVFQVIDPPATELPAGASTTFTLSYTLGLDADTYYAGDGVNVPLKVYSSTGTVLKEFKAHLKVTDNPLWRVTVKSEDETMGTGRLVMGVTGGGTLDDNAGPNIYEETNKVWVLAEPKGEYAVAGAYYYDKKQKQNIDLEECTSVVTTDGKVLYSFDMPAQNVTVYVVFEEPVKAKLRLKLLAVDAGENDSSLEWKLPLRRAGDYVIVQSAENETLDFTEPNYLVIIPAKDERAQIRVELRDILKEEPKVFADVKIVVAYEGGTSTQVYNTKEHTTETEPVLDHKSATFASPQPGHSMLATITISADEDGTTVTRTYTVKIARRPNGENPAEYPLKPGNSPYGMIEGDAGIADADKAAAKAAFDEADCFAAGHTPSRATTLTNIYWPEAWGSVNYDKDPDALFVYLGEDFDDAGPKVVLNTARDEVKLEDVDRTAEVTLLDGTKVTLDMGTANVVRVKDWWKDVSGNAYDIRPGVYAITYSFTDADGLTLNFQRPLIILSRNGDVDLDGKADNTDADMIEGRFDSAIGYGDMFLYRVCDANNDRNLNNVDANAIRDNAARGDKCVIYYLPTDYSDVTAAQP